MFDETRDEEGSVTERSRRLSGVTDAGVESAEEIPAGLEDAPDASDPVAGEEVEEAPVSVPRLSAGRKGKRRRLVRKEDEPPRTVPAPKRLLILDTWKRSGLPAADFAPLVGVSKHTLYKWDKSFEEFGPAGLMDRPRGSPKGSRLSEVTKRTILMLKKRRPEYGCQRISDELARGEGLGASPKAIAKLLHEAGYEMEEAPTRPHPDKVRRFERAKPNQLWQTDIFTFMLKRQNRRVHLVAFMDDHSRYIVSYGLYASMTTPLVLEVVRSAIASYGPPEEILTDNGPQYITWRGKSRFAKEMEKQGIKHIVAKPRRPRTLGKVERFWGTLWRECVEAAIFLDLEDARRRIGLFIDHYNFNRPHQGIEGLVPADRFFSAAEDVKKTMKERIAANAVDLARHGLPKKPFYMTGNVGGKGFSVHTEGERVYMVREDGTREEVDLAGTDDDPQVEALPEAVCPTGPVEATIAEEEAAPGTSPLDDGLARIAAHEEEARHDESED